MQNAVCFFNKWPEIFSHVQICVVAIGGFDAVLHFYRAGIFSVSFWRKNCQKTWNSSIGSGRSPEILSPLTATQKQIPLKIFNKSDFLLDCCDFFRWLICSKNALFFIFARVRKAHISLRLWFSTKFGSNSLAFALSPDALQEGTVNYCQRAALSSRYWLAHATLWRCRICWLRWRAL